MGCCGEPADTPNPQTANRSVAANVGVVNQQPAPQPSPVWQEKAQFQPPNIAAPPPALQYGQNLAAQPQAQQGLAQQQQWGQVQGGQFNPYAAPTSVSPPPSGSATLVNPSLSGYPPTSPSPPFDQTRTPPIMQPAAVYSAIGSGMTMSGRHSVSSGGHGQGMKVSSDEGKLSVAIDFGMHHLPAATVLIANSPCSKVPHSLVW